MTVISDYGSRPSSYANAALEDRFEVIKEIGDGSFGSVALARVRANGASVARRGTMVGFLAVLRGTDLHFLGCYQNHEKDL